MAKPHWTWLQGEFCFLRRSSIHPRNPSDGRRTVSPRIHLIQKRNLWPGGEFEFIAAGEILSRSHTSTACNMLHKKNPANFQVRARNKKSRAEIVRGGGIAGMAPSSPSHPYFRQRKRRTSASGSSPIHGKASALFFPPKPRRKLGGATMPSGVIDKYWLSGVKLGVAREGYGVGGGGQSCCGCRPYFCNGTRTTYGWYKPSVPAKKIARNVFCTLRKKVLPATSYLFDVNKWHTRIWRKKYIFIFNKPFESNNIQLGNWLSTNFQLFIYYTS